jgi:serine/threonine protein kinase/Tfp pilus assembly protein PilF
MSEPTDQDLSPPTLVTPSEEPAPLPADLAGPNEATPTVVVAVCPRPVAGQTSAGRSKGRRARSGSASSTPLIGLPHVGAKIFGFRLLHELGRGSFARVFLAEQLDLAGRLVALKVSTLQGDEPQTLAQLQHTNIVPVYSLHDDAEAGLRAVCMPYFGGACLASVLRALEGGAATARSGGQLVAALDARQADVQPLLEQRRRDKNQIADPKILDWLRGHTYLQAAAWVAARLAEGLEHSHSRGVLHRDIKPSNVLLGADGQPMLLDFNLALSTQSEQIYQALGGTLAYMAPEHLDAVAGRNSGAKVAVDQRADIYALGLVLFELVAGRSPFDKSTTSARLALIIEAMCAERRRASPSVRQVRPDVPWSLESIVRRCLAPDPAIRYQTAGQLAEDLQRFLDDRPLRHAPELSVRERCRKWARRHPRLTSAGLVGSAALVVMMAIGTALVGAHRLLAAAEESLGETRQSLQATQQHLDRAHSLDRKRAFEAAMVTALCRVNTTNEWQDHLRQGQAACETALGLYGVLDCGDWQKQPSWQLLDAAERLQLAEDMRELLLLLGWARVKAGPNNPKVFRDALALLDRAERLTELRPLRALWEDRAACLTQLGETGQAASARKRAAALAPTAPRDHYLLASSLARSGHYDEAVTELNEALRLNPKHYWSLVQRGTCLRQLGKLDLAIADFGRCVGLQPDFAWGYYNLGCVLDHSRQRAAAIDNYSAAIRCDKQFTLAYLNRGLASLELKKHQAALDDFRQAAALGQDDALLHLGWGTALEHFGRASEADVAFALALVRGEALPGPLQVELRLRYGFTVYKRLPEAADRAFAWVLVREGHHPQALYGRAMILVERGEEKAAVACFDEALQWHPGFVDARRFRAVLLARQGNLAAASQDINRCLEAEPKSGITLYAAACVLALAAGQTKDAATARQWEDQALAVLQQALAQGYGHHRIAADNDLRALRHRAEFATLLSSGK